MSNTESRTRSRRAFLRDSGLAMSAAAIAACANDNAAATPVAQNSGGTMGAHDTTKAATAAAAAEQMDAMHEAGIKAFPAKTAGKGNQLLAPRIEGNVKIFDLTAKVIKWEVEPGRMVEAWTYNEV